MKTIFKYTLKILDEQIVMMPWGAQMLDAQFQGNDLVLWVMVDESRDLRIRDVWIRGTGRLYEDLGTYVATAQDPKTGLVWHVFA